MTIKEAAPGPASAQGEMRAAFRTWLASDITSEVKNGSLSEYAQIAFQAGAQWQATRKAAPTCDCNMNSVCAKCIKQAAPSDLHAAIDARSLDLRRCNWSKDGMVDDGVGGWVGINQLQLRLSALAANAAPVRVLTHHNICVVGRSADGNDHSLSICGDGAKDGKYMVLVTLPVQTAVPQNGASDNRPTEAFKYANETVERNLAPALLDKEKP